MSAAGRAFRLGVEQRFGSVSVVGTTMIGSGLYDAAEVALLVGLAPDQVVRWSNASEHGAAPVHATFDRLFSFADLVAFHVAHQVRHSGVSDRHLRRGVERLRSDFALDNPLAVDAVITRLATSGDSFLAQLVDDDYVDIGRGGQGAFQDVIRIHLRRIEFDDNGDPTLWRPVAGVTIDPRVQAGAPCIDGTRIPTAVVSARAAVESTDDIAFDLDIELAAIDAAVRFEELLAKGDGLPV